MKFMATTADMILVTGADFTHTNSLLQLLASVERHEPGMRVMIYDLGMTQRELRRIEKQYRRSLLSGQIGNNFNWLEAGGSSKLV
jgi:hypothetical protein